MNILQANLEYLPAKYYLRSAAERAARHLAGCISGGKHRELQRLLRDHRDEPITDPHEIELSAAIDRLLTCYSSLEIASIANFISAVPDEFAAEGTRILEQPEARRYYERLYPTKLPVLFRRRLAGKGVSLGDSGTERATAAMMAFVELDRQFRENLEDRTLLRMLDSFTIGGYRFSDLVALIATPDRFVEHLVGEDRNRTLGQAARELGLFLQFCSAFRQLLDTIADLPLLQSAMWTSYSSWFGIIGEQLNERLDSALQAFLAWDVPSHAPREEAIRQVQDFVRNGRSVVRELTSSQFAGPIDALLRGSPVRTDTMEA